MRQVGPPLENVFLLRSLRARAVESERSRISRDLHDGILQTLLSLKFSSTCCGAKLPQTPEQAAQGAGEPAKDRAAGKRGAAPDGDRPAPLARGKRGHARVDVGFCRAIPERVTGWGWICSSKTAICALPDRICRELFQIYRESLHNIKKHANASHVVVKLGQDEAKVFLVVDDNGRGFSFSGRFTSEELDRLRLGPISIKERTRSVGGTLTVESNPGHGARLTIEIPLN